MRSIAAIIVTIFWAFVLGIVIGYIGDQLLGEPINYLTMGFIGVVVALIGIFGIQEISKNS